MTTWLKLSHRSHTGKIRPHEHTSYAPLGLLLLVVGFVLSVYTVQAASPGPQAGSVGLTGTVPGKPPTVAATISEPADGRRFSESPVTIAGTCPENTLVEIFKNDIFAGSTACSDRGTYELQVDLLIGKNDIVARVYDALNQPGPPSRTVTIYYDALPQQLGPVSALDFGTQLLLNTDAVFRGVFPEQEMNVPIQILGGAPPYALNVEWGDSSNNVIPRGDNVSFSTAHAYKKPGVYQINLQATDTAGRVAFMSVAAIVNGQPDTETAAAIAGSNSSGIGNRLLVLWPLYVSAVGIVISFWLGEQREKKVLKNHGLIVQPQ